jgi:hypothetical protein
MDQTKIDCLPTIEELINISKQFGDDLVNKKFDKNQKPDFYLGMIAASRMFMSYVKHYEKYKNDGETLEQLEGRVLILSSDVAKIILDKYDLKGFKR